VNEEDYYRELTWEERKNLLTDDQLMGRVPDKNGRMQGEFGNISPFTDIIIHYWLDCHGIPRKILDEKYLIENLFY
jgi:hypothetical protein